MDDSTPERSLGGTADAHEPDDEAIARLLARTQAERRRVRTIITVDRDNDGYILTFRYLTADQAERIIRQARRPLPRAAQRALHFLDRLRPTRGGRKPKQRTGLTDQTAAEIEAVMRSMKEAGFTDKQIIAQLRNDYPEDQYERRWNREAIRRWLKE